MSRHAMRSCDRLLKIDAFLAVAGVVLLAAVCGLTVLLAADLGDTLTRNTVRLSLAWYALALCLMMQLDPADWTAQTPAGRWARDCWTWALVCFLVHLGVAFHYWHDWSHAHAFERTRQVSGTGEGIYVSYLFTVLWAVDALAWWLWPAVYARRTPWIDRALHAFMLFIVFNSMIVFEEGPIRWAGVAMFAGFGVAWLVRQRGRAARRAPQIAT